jgi:hypothetical protein
MALSTSSALGAAYPGSMVSRVAGLMAEVKGPVCAPRVYPMNDVPCMVVKVAQCN